MIWMDENTLIVISESLKFCFTLLLHTTQTRSASFTPSNHQPIPEIKNQTIEHDEPIISNERRIENLNLIQKILKVSERGKIGFHMIEPLLQFKPLIEPKIIP
jgi:hypothetical protein